MKFERKKKNGNRVLLMLVVLLAVVAAAILLLPDGRESADEAQDAAEEVQGEIEVIPDAEEAVIFE
ncbi:MAG: hypothetical protein J1D86_00205 [Alistipes sp.]|nr:hypothetical protein [Alistipes sp.]